jgi:hypothetical protein
MRHPRRGLSAPRNRPTLYRPRSLPVAVIPLFVAVAVLGYAAGHLRSGNGAGDAGRTATSAHVLIEYPVGWKRAAGGARIPGLAIAHAQLIVVARSEANAGLIVGTLPAGELGPLPKRFVAGLKQLPQTAVVELVEGQAYRYTHFTGPGFAVPLTLFVIPNPGGDPTALACYAPSPTSPYMRTCEGIVSGVTVVGQSQIFQLTPEAGYAAKIGAATELLDRLRVALKRELHPQISAARAQQLATELADGFAKAGESLSLLEPSPAVAPLQKALQSGMQRARDGYRALSQAAAERSLAAYTDAQTRISGAEADVDRSLQDFVLLGYGSSLQIPAKSGS